MPSAAELWIESLSPWPEEFGLERMRALMAALGEPQRAFPSVHVVGTNGKSTAAATIAARLEAEGVRAGAYLSPHVSGWAERIRIGGEEADFDEAIGRVRAAAVRLGATQFETLTAAAFAAFADAGVEAAAVEAGLGGRLDATNVIDAPVVLLTNVSEEHTEVLGQTREEIAREKLAVAHDARVVVLPDNSFRHLVPRRAEVRVGGAREAVEAFLGRRVEADVEVALAGRLERRAGGEVWDGAHNPAGVEWLTNHLEPGYVVCASILRDKNAEAMLAGLARLGRTLVATQSSNERALPAADLAQAARRHFEQVEVVPDPEAALDRARALGRPLVTGSLYLLADLSRAHGRRRQPVR
jgi:dihydrofolate synthase / folylpolyglutamate synthase